MSKGGFGWSLGFTWMSQGGQERKKMRDFFATQTPVMIGGLLAIERRYFWEIGFYNPGMLGIKTLKFTR